MVQEQLDTIFEQQKEYICCCEGCSSCCEEGMYPYSELEFRYLMIGFRQLSDEEKEQVISETKKLLEIYKEKNCECFMHKCPFLINGECSVYPYRGIVCRVHGLAWFDGEKVQLPYCVNTGLNYSKVFDRTTGEVFLPNVIQEHLRIDNILKSPVAQSYELECGEIRPLINWF